MMQTVFTSFSFTLLRYTRFAVESTQSDTKVRLDSKGIKGAVEMKTNSFDYTILDGFLLTVHKG